MEERTINTLSNALVAKGEKLLPCSLAEVIALESFFKIDLPPAYKEFLLKMGKGSGSFMIGSDFEYHKLFELKNEANRLLLENNLEILPISTFVFWMHQGYQFCYFYLGENKNPNVYYFNEVNKKMNKIANTLTDFFYSFPKSLEI